MFHHPSASLSEHTIPPPRFFLSSLHASLSHISTNNHRNTQFWISGHGRAAAYCLPGTTNQEPFGVCG